ncbi:MAG: PhoPQ-activated protein PqaA family protein [Cyclobacteriaceae bacterium]|nr:PhoPQ-activated protein PqaA family protein [Cyclobacteriaceae bacterium]
MKNRITYFLILLAITAISCTKTEKGPTTAENALQQYLDNGDKTYKWQKTGTFDFTNGGGKGYDLLLTSQTWREFTWKHQLTVLVPEVTSHDGALLFITGGGLENGEPKMKGSDDDLVRNLSIIAAKNRAIVCIVRQVPNQPLYDDLTEDELISYTLHNFKNDGDFTWPLLFPMVKSAVKAMDAVKEFSDMELRMDIKRFLVSGASKRGWTTWLTGASDPRVTAIAPMVIDVLNMPKSLDYQVEVWKEYSIQIEDYVKLEIPQQVHSEKGDKLTKMIDPYSYRQNLTMPKMIIIGTNDEYWPVDAIKNYYDSIPGNNSIEYVPNAGHDLGDKKQAFQILSSFFSGMLLNQPMPKCDWEIAEDSSGISLTALASADLLLNASIWTADSEDRDFRDEGWEERKLNVAHEPQVQVKLDYPDTGFAAFYIDLEYADANGDRFVQSTRMFVADSTQVFVH